MESAPSFSAKMSLGDLARDVIQRFLNKDAILFDDGEICQRMSFSDLSIYAKQTEDCLRKNGAKEEVIGTMLHPSLGVPAHLLGILGAPAAFFTLSSDTPQLRLCQTVTSACLRFIICSLQYLEILLSKLESFKPEVLEKSLWDKTTLVHLTIVPPSKWRVPLAYVITTSGTTGEPKLVRVPHHCIVPNITHLISIFKVTSEDLLFQTSPLTFDPSIVDIFVSISSGATLLITPDIIKMVPRTLVQMLCCRHQVTVLQATPTLISMLGPQTLQETLLGNTSGLRVLALGGEAFPSLSTLRSWRHPDNNTQIYNLYGITEVSCWASYYCIPQTLLHKECKDDPDIPLGQALQGTVMKVHDSQGSEVRLGCGHLMIGGTDRMCIIGDEECVAAGVTRDTGDLVKVDEAGNIFYLGRTDEQVKRHGKRFNLMELEQVALQCPLVHCCKAILTSKARLHLFLVSRTSRDTTEYSGTSAESKEILNVDIKTEVQQHLSASLPPHCQADRLHVIQSLPVNRHGKVNRDRLNQMAEEWLPASCQIDDISMSDIQTYSETLWRRFLSLGPLTQVTDANTFLDQGGDSLTAIQLADTMQNIFQCSMPLLLDFILHQTFGKLVEYIKGIAGKRQSKNEFAAKELTPECKLGQQLPDMRCNIAENSEVEKDNFPKSKEASSISNLEKQTGSVCPQLLPGKIKCINEEHRGFSGEKLSVKRPRTQTEPFEVSSEFGSGYDTKTIPCRDFRHEPKKRCKHLLPDKVIPDDLSSLLNCESETTLSKREVAAGCDDMKDLFVYSVQRGNRTLNIVHADKNKAESRCIMERHAYMAQLGMNSVMLHERRTISLSEMWTFNSGKCVDASPLVAYTKSGKGYVFIGSHSHKFSAVSMETGQALWEVMLGDRVESSACLSPCGNYVVVGCYDGCIYTLTAKTGAIFWKFMTKEQVKCSPCVDLHSGLVFVGSHDQTVYALKVKDKQCVWSQCMGVGSVFSSPCISQYPAVLYVATLAGLLSSLQPNTGMVSWQYDCRKPLFSSPACINGGVCIGCVDGSVQGISHSGQLMWRFQTQAPVFCSPVVWSCRPTIQSAKMNLEKVPSPAGHPTQHHQAVSAPCNGTYVVFGCHDNHVYCVSKTGKLEWKFNSASPIYSSPFIYSITEHISTQNCQNYTCPLRQISKGIIDSSVQNFPPRNNSADESIPMNENSSRENETCEWGKVECVDVVIVCSTSGMLYVLALQTGDLVTSYQLPGEVFSSPVAVNGTIIIGCRDDNLYALKMTVG